MVRFSVIPDKLTIQNILIYTYNNKLTHSRYYNSERDVLPSTIKVVQRTVYKKNKEGQYSAPEERLMIISKSAPQYAPYNSNLRKGTQRQMKVKHQYDIILCIQPINDKKEYSLDSKMIWRVGSYKKYKKAPQKYVKTIYSETRENLKKRFSKYKDCNKKVKKEIDKIRKNAPYLCDGDYQAQIQGIMLDCYYRDYYVQNKFGCLYGPCWYKEQYEGILLPFADKHLISVINILIRKKIIKV